MKCLSCDVPLSDYESTRKYEDGTFVDLCNHCWFNSDMYYSSLVHERDDLISIPIKEIKHEDLDFGDSS